MRHVTLVKIGTRRRAAIVLATCVLGAGTSLALTWPAAASVKTASIVPGCSNATLSGRYTFEGSGYIIAGGGSLPFALAGAERYDGAGGVAGTLSQSVNGAIVSGVAETGTYTIRPDCTGTATNTVAGTTTHFDLFTDPTGLQLKVIETDPGTVLAGTENRVVG